ncbi:MAG: SCO family protein, partial [Actinomycetota bacterium]
DATPKELGGYVLTPAPVVADLALPDASRDGMSFPFKAATGRLLVVYFGYMSCPDVCPTTLNEFKNALKDARSVGSKVDLAMVTVDPGRDTGANLTRYVQGFVPGAHALRTDDQTLLTTVAKTFGASYSVTTDAKGAIVVTHTAAMYLVDSTGTVVLTWPYGGIQRDGMATDLRTLFDRGVK